MSILYLYHVIGITSTIEEETCMIPIQHFLENKECDDKEEKMMK